MIETYNEKEKEKYTQDIIKSYYQGLFNNAQKPKKVLEEILNHIENTTHKENKKMTDQELFEVAKMFCGGGGS